MEPIVYSDVSLAKSNTRPATGEIRRAPSSRSVLNLKFIAMISIAINLALISWLLSPYTAHLVSNSRAKVVHAKKQCKAPLPTFLTSFPPSSSNKHIQSAEQSFSKELLSFWEAKDMDSLSLAVVTSSRSVFEAFRGVLRANETEDKTRGRVDRNSIYRIASVSKMFAALETMILRDRGVLNLDDPISKYIPEFKHMPQDNSQITPITFRQLMSHMAGLGRDYPPGDATPHWPKSLDGRHPAPYNGLKAPSEAEFLESIATHRQVSGPYNYPSYSNTGFSLLGISNAAAVMRSEGVASAPQTYAELMKRDVFDKLGINGSSFNIDDSNRPFVVVGSYMSSEVDHDFRNANNAGGGQLSSLADLIKVAQSFIDPSSASALLSASTVREWLRPIHSGWDDLTGVGMVWEITRLQGPNDKIMDMYQKLGNLFGQHASFSIIPSHSFGMIALHTGPTGLQSEIDKLLLKHFSPAFEHVAIDITTEILSGKWADDDQTTELVLGVEDGALYAYGYYVNGTDALAALNEGRPIAKTPLWSTGNDELKFAPVYHEEGALQGCLSQWGTLDQYGYMNGYPVNLIQIQIDKSDFSNNVLFLPATGVSLRR